MSSKSETPPSVLKADPPVLAIGEVVADVYEVRSLLGAGGMGEVYEAHDKVLNRRVALKVVRPNIAHDYLLREGRALAAIKHPGIVAVHTMGTHKGARFLVLERVQGLSLDRMLEERRSRGERFAVFEALDLVVSIADALSVVHRAGLAHRDIKPANVMLAPGARVVLMDFGLVLPHADRAGHRSVAGSVQYMAPEALTGDVAEGAASLVDVYALGVLAFELLSGVLPFGGAQPIDTYRSKTRVAVPRLTSVRTDVSQPLSDLVAQMMAIDPNDRPQGAEAVLWQLRAIRGAAGSGGAVRPFAVLIVDDDPDMRDALSLYVRAAAGDADIETTGDGRQAVRSVRRRVPDLLLLDLDLPDINGIEVCMLLRGMQLGDACTIVSVSAKATPADVDLLEQLGVRSMGKGPALVNDLAQLIGKIRASSVRRSRA
ncbi:MAG TPA: serine/threonine-protein kinase [Polyangiaceae bacterium]|nr:serine/threonine-protein kinase [Polyangiaceae bacterium]